MTQQKVESALESLATALDAAARQYADVESVNMRMFG